MVKERERENDAQLVVRLPGQLIERVDAYAERLREEMAGVKLSRADVVRLLLTRALDDTEKKGRAKR